MLVKAEQKNIRISQRKVNLLVGEVKKMSPRKALASLEFSNNRAAEYFAKVIKQAISNAVNVKKIDEKTLKFKEILVQKGPVLKRWRPKARGRISPIQKKSCHLRIILEGRKGE